MNNLIIPLKCILSLCCFCCNSPQDNTPIHSGSREFIEAITDGNLELVKFFAQEEGSDITFPDGGPNEYIGSCKPIHIAAMTGQLDIVKYFIEEEKVEFDTPCKTYSKTPLIYAIEKNKTEIIEYLISKGAKINGAKIKGERFNTPLHSAIEKGELKAVKLLVKSGANFSTENYLSYNAIDIAAISGRLDMAKYILLKNKKFLNTENDPRNRMLRKACWYEKLPATRYLLEQGAKITNDLDLQNNKENEDYVKEVKFLDNLLDFTEVQISTQNNNQEKIFINFPSRIDLYISKIAEKITSFKDLSEEKLFVNLIFRRYLNLLSENSYCEICSKIFNECKKNKPFSDKIKNHLRLKNLEEREFYNSIKEDLSKNCIDKEKRRNTCSNFNKEEFKRNLINSKVEHDLLIRCLE